MPHSLTKFATLLLVCCTPASLCLSQVVDEAYFENQVRPLLDKHCLSCHGPSKQESDLRLDHRDHILQGGSSGEPAAVAGDATGSLLAKYVRHEVEGMEMPPEADRLSDDEIAILEKWIEGGVVWPSDSVAVLTMDQRLAEHRKVHWAFQTPRVSKVDRSAIPKKWKNWPRSGMDQYVLRRLLSREMTPSKLADRRTLLRRLTFDLTGLPPTIADVKAFENENSPDAISKLVDRLLASPQYGEHWGRHWLDVARYADTRGYSFQKDRNYPWAFTYRDYVVRSLNRDLPFNQFVLEQLAADLLSPNENDNRALAALGFLTVGRKFNNTHDDIDDKIDAVTRGFMGLTIACARCHDHKYDAIPTEDYYSLYGVFASSTEPGSLPLIGEAATLADARSFEDRFAKIDGALRAYDESLKAQVTQEAHTRIKQYFIAAADDENAASDLRPKLVEAWRRFLKRKASADDPILMPWFRLQKVDATKFAAKSKELAEQIRNNAPAFLNSTVREVFTSSPPASKSELASLYGGVLESAYEVWQKAGGDGRAREKQSAERRQLLWYFSDFNSPATIDAAKARRYATDAETAKRKELQAAVDRLNQVKPVVYHRAMVVKDKATPATAHVFIRGQSGRKGKEVARQGPVLLSKADRLPYEKGSGRFELAQEIINEQNPLTARVFVNRVWLHHFGRPLVGTPSDFGIRCEAPVQQDLLDYLAVRFMENNWSIKWLHREILLSATYQQASGDRPELYAIDPDNTLLWRANRKRLGFEATRDSLLAVSARLDTTVGGKAEKLFTNPEKGRRRSVYGYVDRQDLPNLLRVFDFASPDQSVATRTSTMVPQQALFLLNSPFVLELAQELAEADVWASLGPTETVVLAYEKILSRKPKAREIEIGVALLAAGDNVEPLAARSKLIHVLVLTNEFIYVD